MKRNRGPQSRPASRVQGALSIGLLLALLLNPARMEQVGAQTTVAPTPASEALTQWLPSRLGEGTTSIESVGPVSLLRSADWRVLEDAAVWEEYGMIDLSIRRYRVEKRVVQAELFRHQTPAGAFGRQSFQRLTRPPDQSSAEFAVGPFFVRLSAPNTPGPLSGKPLHTADLPFKQLGDALRSTLAPEEEAGPVLLKHLPTVRRQPNSETYFLGPVALGRHPSFGPVANLLDFTSQPETVTATYVDEVSAKALELLLVEYYTPQAATDNLSRLEGYVANLPPDKQSQHRLRRIGNYLALIISDTSPTNADQIFNQIRYEQKVYWYGRKVTDIPLDFRPADAAAWREMTNTTTIVVQSLVWIALMLGLTVLIGMLIGGMIFYWRRYQRRKRGIDNLFSDAGETIFLNLDDYLLRPQTEPPAPPRLQLAPLERPEEALDEPQVPPPATSG